MKLCFRKRLKCVRVIVPSNINILVRGHRSRSIIYVESKMQDRDMGPKEKKKRTDQIRLPLVDNQLMLSQHVSPRNPLLLV